MVETENFHATRVVSRNFIVDFLQHIRNLFGWRLRGYEQVLEEAMDSLMSEVEEEYDLHHDDSWYRVDVDPMTHGTAIVKLYGQAVRKGED